MKRVALITGGNRGIGLEVCKQLSQRDFIVILSARDSDTGEKMVTKLREDGGDVHFLLLDTSDSESMKRAIADIDRKFARLDVLINNAGILLDRDLSPEKTSIENLKKTLDTNVYGPYYLCQLSAPLMRKNHYGRIVNVSSGAGQLLVRAYAPSYSVSKAALNAVTCQFAAAFKKDGILVNSVTPGWVRTSMGGSSAPLSLEEGADSIVWAATLPNDGPTGGFFRDRKSIHW